MAAEFPTDRQKPLLSLHPSALLSQLKNAAHLSKQCCCQCVGEDCPAKAVSCDPHASQLLEEFLSQCCAMGWKCFVEATGVQCLLWALLEHGLCPISQCLQIVDEILVPVVLETRTSDSIGHLGCRFLDAFVQSRTKCLDLSTGSGLLPDIVHLFQRLFQSKKSPGDTSTAEPSPVIVLDERDEETSRGFEGQLVGMEHVLPICNDLSIRTVLVFGEWVACSEVFGDTDVSSIMNLDFVNPSPVARILVALCPEKLFEVWRFIARKPLCRCRYNCCAGLQCSVERGAGYLLKDLVKRPWSNFARIFLTALVRLPSWSQVLSLVVARFARCKNVDEGDANYNHSREPKLSGISEIAPRKRQRPSLPSDPTELTIAKRGHNRASPVENTMLVLLCSLPAMQSPESLTPFKALLDCFSHPKFLEAVVLNACSERPDSCFIGVDHGCTHALVDLFAHLQLFLWLRLSVADSSSPTQVSQGVSTAMEVVQFLRGAGGSNAHPEHFRQQILVSFQRAVAFELMTTLIDGVDPQRHHGSKVAMLPMKAGGATVSRQRLLSYLLKTVEVDSDGVQGSVAETAESCVAPFVASGLCALLEDFLLSPTTCCQLLSRHRLVILLKVWAWPSMCAFIFQHALGNRIRNHWKPLAKLWALPQRLLLATGYATSNQDVETTFGYCPSAMKLWKTALEDLVESQRIVPSFLFDAIAVVLNCVGWGDDYNAACLFLALQAVGRTMPVESKPESLFCASSASSSASSSAASTSSSCSAPSKKGRKFLSRKARRTMSHNTYLKWFKSLNPGRGVIGTSTFVLLATTQPELRVAHLLTGGLSKALESSKPWFFPVGGIHDRRTAQAGIEGLQNNLHVQLHRKKSSRIASTECLALESKMLLLCQTFQHVLIPNKASRMAPDGPQVTAIEASKLVLAFDGVLLYALLNPVRDVVENLDTGVSSSNELHHAVFDTGLRAVQQEATALTLALRAGNTIDSRRATDVVTRFSRVVLLAGQLTSSMEPLFAQESARERASFQSQDVTTVPLHRCLACLVSGSLFDFLDVYAQHRQRERAASFGWYPSESSANGIPVRVDESRSAISLFQFFEDVRDMLEASAPQAPVLGDLSRLQEPFAIIDQLLLWSLRNGPGATGTCVMWGQSWLGLQGSINDAATVGSEEPSHVTSRRNVPMHPVVVLTRALRLCSNVDCVASVIRHVHAGAYLAAGGPCFGSLLPQNSTNIFDCAWVPPFLGLCETALRATPLKQLQSHLHGVVLAARPMASVNNGDRDQARKSEPGSRAIFGILLLRLLADLCLTARTVCQALCSRFFRNHVVPLWSSIEMLMSTCSNNIKHHWRSPSQSRSGESDAHHRTTLEYTLDTAGAWLSLLQALVHNGRNQPRVHKNTIEGDEATAATEMRQIRQILGRGARSVLSFAKGCPEDVFSPKNANERVSQCCARIMQKASFASGLAAQMLFETAIAAQDPSAAAVLPESESSTNMIGQLVQELLETGHRACSTWDLVHGNPSECPFDSVFGIFKECDQRCDRHQVKPGLATHAARTHRARNDDRTSPTPNLLAEFCAYLHKLVRKMPQEVESISALVHGGAFRCCIRVLSAAFTLFFRLGGRLQKPVMENAGGGRTDDIVQCPAGLSLSKVLCCIRHLQLAISSLRQAQPSLWQMLLATGDVEWVERTALAYCPRR